MEIKPGHIRLELSLNKCADSSLQSTATCFPATVNCNDTKSNPADKTKANINRFKVHIKSAKCNDSIVTKLQKLGKITFKNRSHFIICLPWHWHSVTRDHGMEYSSGYCPPVWDLLLALTLTLSYKGPRYGVLYRLLSTCVGSFACPDIDTQLQGTTVWSPLQATVHLCGIFCWPWHGHSWIRDHSMESSTCCCSPAWDLLLALT
jgi:hypothetical protein